MQSRTGVEFHGHDMNCMIYKKKNPSAHGDRNRYFLMCRQAFYPPDNPRPKKIIIITVYHFNERKPTVCATLRPYIYVLHVSDYHNYTVIANLCVNTC